MVKTKENYIRYCKSYGILIDEDEFYHNQSVRACYDEWDGTDDLGEPNIQCRRDNIIDYLIEAEHRRYSMSEEKDPRIGINDEIKEELKSKRLSDW